MYRFRFVALLILFATHSPALGQEAAEDPLRLGSEVVPTHQSVNLRLDADLPDYEGSVAIDLEVREATDIIRFHAQEMELTKISLSGGDGEIGLTHEEGENHLIVVRTERELAPGKLRLDIEFTNDFDLTSKSLYRIKFEGNNYLFTQMEAEDARGAIPCWDEPAFKITWDFTISAPEQQTVVFNMPEAEASSSDGWRTARYETTPPMPSYLLAMAVGPLELVPIEGMSVPGNIVCPKGKSDLAAEAVQLTPPILAKLEEYFGRPYPYPKLDHIAVPEFWPGAMENPGAITYRDTILLLDSAEVTSSERSTLAHVAAHEIAHMWFGDLVTMQWWDDLWLNESFATWLGRKVTDQVYPEFGVAVSTVEDNADAMASDAQVVAEPIRRDIMADQEKMSDVALLYDKGAAVLGMFESFIGEDLFRQGIVDYVNTNEWSNARAGDLWTAIGDNAGLDMASAMATFLEQPGVPRVDATVLGDGRVELKQERYLNYGAEIEDSPTWQIPIVFKYSDKGDVKTHKVMLREPTQVVELPGGVTPEWIHPNADERGYYHWSVDPEMLRALIADAPERMNERERVAFVAHVGALLTAGEMDGGRYLETIGKLATDPDAEVLETALGALGGVRVAFVTEKNREAFRAYTLTLTRPLAERYGYVPEEGESHAVSNFRADLLAWLGVFGRDPDFIAFAEAYTQSYLEDPTSGDASVARSCLRTAAVGGDWKLYNALKKGFETAEIPGERNRYLAAMGQFENKAIAKAALSYALDDAVRPQEMFSIIQRVGQMHEDEGLVWSWFVDNYDVMTARLPEMYRAYMPYFAGGCDAERLEAARVFFAEEEHQATGLDTQLAKVAEGVEDCVSLREREGSSVDKFLSGYASAK